MLRAQITAMHIPLDFDLKHTMEYIRNASIYTFVYFPKFISKYACA